MKIYLILAIVIVIFISSCSNNKETTETGGTLKEWKELMIKDIGQDSEPVKTAEKCEAALNKNKADCSQYPGWRINNIMEITDFKTNEPYNFQDTINGGCSEKDPKQTITGNFDSQSEKTDSSYQVVCSFVCVWWECEESKNKLKAEAWSGEITAKLEDLDASCSDGEVSLSYTFTLNSPVSLVSALKGTQEITLWSEPGYKETSGTIKGTAVINNQPSKDNVIYCELEGGQSEEVPITFFATSESIIQLSEVPGSQKNIRTPRFGKQSFYHKEAGLTDESILAGFPPLLLANSISDVKISGQIKPGYGYSGTFTLTKI